jgi:hypothetical protein
MEDAVTPFAVVLRDKRAMRGVAVITDGDVMML